MNYKSFENNKLYSNRSRLRTGRILQSYINAKNRTPEEKKMIRDFVVELGTKYNATIIAEMDAGIKAGSNLSRRNVATSRLAAMLGISDMVATSRLAAVKHKGELMEGNVMEEAEDTSDKDITKCTYSMDAVSQLAKLQLFDLVCGQIDRKYGNYTNITRKGKITQIIAIDNDLSFGDLSYDDLIMSRMEPRVLSYQNLAFFPAEFMNKIAGLNPDELRLNLMDLLTKEEIDAVYERIKQLQVAFRESRELLEMNTTGEEQEILKDPELGPLWLLYTLRDKKILKGDEEASFLEAHTYIIAQLVPGEDNLKTEIRNKLNKKKMKVDCKKFKFLKGI
jgi:hypothetical protein